MNDFSSRSVLVSPIKIKNYLAALGLGRGTRALQPSERCCRIFSCGIWDLAPNGTRPPALGALGLSYRTIREVSDQYVLNSNSQPWYTIGYILLLLHLLLDILGL